MENQFTLSYAGYYGKRFEDFSVVARDLGFLGVQFIPDQTPNFVHEFDEHRLRELAEFTRAAHLAVSVHAIFYDINLVSVVPEIQSFALSVLRSNFEFARSLGASVVTVHPGYMFPGWRSSPWQEEVFWRSANQGIRALDRLAQEYGILACLENGSYYVSSKASQKRIPLHVGITIEEMQHLLNDVSDSVGLCLDVGKALVSGVGVTPFLREFGGRIAQVQIASIDHLSQVTLDPYFGSMPKMPELVFEGGSGRASEFIRSISR